MSQLTRRVRTELSRANVAVGRRIGRTIAPSPLPNSVTAELRTLLTGLGISHVVDVGAHHGGFARRLRTDVGYHRSITSFEPSPRHYQELLSAASGDPGWSAMNVALGAEEGTAEFHEFTGDGQFDSLRSLGPHAEVYDAGLRLGGTIGVSVQRLDSVWPKLGAMPAETFLKVDTQGFDLEVLAGAGELLEHIPGVMLEVAVQPLYEGAPVVADVFGAMASKRFELTGAFPIHRYGGGLRVIEFDCTFVNQRLFGT
jgi:FkbM family methyltransferase